MCCRRESQLLLFLFLCRPSRHRAELHALTNAHQTSTELCTRNYAHCSCTDSQTTLTALAGPF